MNSTPGSARADKAEISLLRKESAYYGVGMEPVTTMGLMPCPLFVI